VFNGAVAAAAGVRKGRRRAAPGHIGDQRIIRFLTGPIVRHSVKD
jgi:hypothetical protein